MPDVTEEEPNIQEVMRICGLLREAHSPPPSIIDLSYAIAFFVAEFCVNSGIKPKSALKQISGLSGVIIDECDFVPVGRDRGGC